MPIRYHKLRVHRLSWGELRVNAADPVALAVMSVCKLVGWTPVLVSFPRCDELPLVEWTDLDDAARAAVRASVAELVADGWDYQFCYEVPYLESNRVCAACLLLSADRRTGAGTVYYRDPSVTRRGVLYSTRLDDDTYVQTMGYKRFIQLQPEILSEYHPGLDRRALLDRHAERVVEFEKAGRRVRPLDPATLPESVSRVERASVDFQVARGVMTPMTAREVRQLGGRPGDGDGAGGEREGEILR